MISCGRCGTPCQPEPMSFNKSRASSGKKNFTEQNFPQHFQLFHTPPMKANFIIIILQLLATLKSCSANGKSNPASVFCTDNGGRSILYDGQNFGQFGVCYFNRNRCCDEWTMFRSNQTCPALGIPLPVRSNPSLGYENYTCARSPASTGFPHGGINHAIKGKNFLATMSIVNLKSWPSLYSLFSAHD
jgi:putative hemolysin